MLEFSSSGNAVTGPSGFGVNIDSGFSGISNHYACRQVVDLGVQFTNGLAGAK